MPNTAVNIK